MKMGKKSPFPFFGFFAPWRLGARISPSTLDPIL